MIEATRSCFKAGRDKVARGGGEVAAVCSAQIDFNQHPSEAESTGKARSTTTTNKFCVFQTTKNGYSHKQINNNTARAATAASQTAVNVKL